MVCCQLPGYRGVILYCSGSARGRTAIWTMFPIGSKPTVSASSASNRHQDTTFGCCHPIARPPLRPTGVRSVALCRHLEAVDGTEGTVIAIQIENEPGILGSDCDYGAVAQAELESPVPDTIVSRLAAGNGGWIHTQWQAAGARSAGSWPEALWSGRRRVDDRVGPLPSISTDWLRLERLSAVCPWFSTSGSVRTAGRFRERATRLVAP